MHRYTNLNAQSKTQSKTQSKAPHKTLQRTRNQWLWLLLCTIIVSSCQIKQESPRYSATDLMKRWQFTPQSDHHDGSPMPIPPRYGTIPVYPKYNHHDDNPPHYQPYVPQKYHNYSPEADNPSHYFYLVPIIPKYRKPPPKDGFNRPFFKPVPTQ